MNNNKYFRVGQLTSPRQDIRITFKALTQTYKKRKYVHQHNTCLRKIRAQETRKKLTKWSLSGHLVATKGHQVVTYNFTCNTSLKMCFQMQEDHCNVQQVDPSLKYILFSFCDNLLRLLIS